MHHRATRMAMNPRGEARKARERRRSSRLSLFSRQPFSSCLGGRDFLVARRRFHCSGGRVTFVTPCPPPLAFTGPPPASVRLPRPVHACCPVSRPERCTHPAKKTLPVSTALSLAHVAAAATERQSATVYEGMLGICWGCPPKLPPLGAHACAKAATKVPTVSQAPALRTLMTTPRVALCARSCHRYLLAPMTRSSPQRILLFPMTSTRAETGFSSRLFP